MFISGVGRTKFGKLSGSLVELAYEAMYKAIEDSPLDIGDIDAVFVSNFLGGPLNGQLHLNSVISSLLPGSNLPVIRVETACASSSVALNQALHCAGSYSNILVIGVEKMTGPQLIPSTDAISMAADHELDFKNGLIFPAAYALIAQQYMQKYGVGHELLEKVALLNHKNANLNPLAHFYHKEVDLQLIKNAPSVADPLTLFDCSPVSDGAAALVLSREKLSDRDIRVLACKIATDTISLTQREDLTSFKATRIAARAAYRQAGIQPEDLDLVEVHDCFTISELLALEDLQLCRPGKAFELVEEGALAPGGRLPVNTDGGLKANGHPIGASGMAQVYELVTQLRQEAGKRQVRDPKIGLAQNIGGVGGTTGITILGV